MIAPYLEVDPGGLSDNMLILLNHTYPTFLIFTKPEIDSCCDLGL